MTQRHTIRLTPQASTLNPRSLHKALMRSLSHVRLDSTAPRADAAMTFTRSGPDEVVVYTRPGISFVVPWQIGEVADSRPLELPGGTARFTVTVARQYRPTIPRDPDVVAMAARRGEEAHTTGRRVPVPADRLVSWATDMLRRSGVDATDVHAEAAPDLNIDSNPRSRIPTATITATATAAQIAAVIESGGLGRGKNYGLGHITPIN